MGSCLTNAAERFPMLHTGRPNMFHSLASKVRHCLVHHLVFPFESPSVGSIPKRPWRSYTAGEHRHSWTMIRREQPGVQGPPTWRCHDIEPTVPETDNPQVASETSPVRSSLVSLGPSRPLLSEISVLAPASSKLPHTARWANLGRCLCVMTNAPPRKIED